MVDGTMSGNMSCSLESGQCYCKDNVEGRACDHCTYGSYAYPHCESCDCELKGTTERICDQVYIKIQIRPSPTFLLFSPTLNVSANLMSKKDLDVIHVKRDISTSRYS